MPTNDTTEPTWATDTNFASGPYSGSPTKVEPTSGQAAQGHVPGSRFRSGFVNRLLHRICTWLADTNRSYYGDGSDGTVVLGAGTTTLTRDMYYENLTLGATSVLATGGFKIFVRNLCTIPVGAVVRHNGAPGLVGVDANTGGVAGAGATGGTMGAGFNGGAGGSDANGANGTNASASLGGAGGAGGNSNDTGNGGTGGTTTLASITVGFRHLAVAMGYSDAGVQWRGGAGGAGGGGGDTGSGGGGGGGGGCLFLAAYRLVLEGEIEALGGDGGDGFTGPDALGNGGGGGGGGGVIWLVTRGRSGSGTVLAAGGEGGVGHLVGENGDPGSTGTVVELAA